MSLRRWRIRVRLRVALTSLFLFGVLLGTPYGVAASTPARLAIDAGATSGDLTSYRLRVVSEGSPVLALMPDEVRTAELVVNGAVVARTGRDVDLGIPPFGHAAATFRLAGLARSDLIEIRQRGAAGRPTILDDPDHLGMAFDAALWSGIGYGVLFTLVLLILKTVFASGERAMLWYVSWLGAFLCILFARDGLLPLPPDALQAALLLADLTAIVSYVGFVSAFLELRRQAPRMFWFFVGAVAVLAASPGVVGARTHSPPPIDVLFLANGGAMALGIIIALLRRRAGFQPATYLAVGLVGTLIFFVGKPLRDVAGIDSPFLDRWAILILDVFDFLVFSLGITSRSDLKQREHELMKAQLQATNLVAALDPLTGMLNRRGLEEWMRAHGQLTGIVLFIDLDGFKAVNDHGGHAAGDRTLIAVADIIRQSLRSTDAAARFGGDEFVIVITDCDDLAITQRIVARMTSAIALLTPLEEHGDIRIGCSIGCARISDSQSFAATLERADADAYRIKQLHHANDHALRNLVSADGTPRT